MSKLIPIFSEKSTEQAKHGVYTFRVHPSLTKSQIKNLVASSFGVHPVMVATLTLKKNTKRNMYGKIVTQAAVKKALVRLKKDEKIDIFQTEEKKKGKKK